MSTVHKEWMPTANTITNLQKKYHYTRRQVWNCIKLFRVNFNGREFQDIDKKFVEVVRKEPAHNTPKPDNTVSDKLDKKRADDIANRSEDAHEKAVESHKIDSDKMSNEDALKFYMKHRH